jgi:hypothetical protein
MFGTSSVHRFLSVLAFALLCSIGAATSLSASHALATAGGGWRTGAAAGAAGVSIQPAAVTVTAGQSTTLTVQALAPATGLGDWEVDITFNPAVVSIDAAGCAATVDPSTTALCTVNYNNQPNTIRVSGAAFPGLSGTSTLASLTFQAIGGAGSQSPLGVTVVSFDDSQGVAIPNPSAANGLITIAGQTVEVNPTASTVVATPANLPDDGATPATVTVALIDQNGAPVMTPKTVSLSEPSASHALLAAQPNGAPTAGAVSGATSNGQIVFAITDATAEAVTLTANDVTDGLTLDETPVVTFTPVAVSQASAPAGGSITVTVTVPGGSGAVSSRRTSRDVSGQSVTLVANSGTAATITCKANSNPCLTDQNGQASFSVTDSTTQGLILTATDTTTNQALGTATVVFGTLPYGDVNGDGVRNSTDALCILRDVAALPSTGACPSPLPGTPDVNGDGHVNATDALCVLRAVAALAVTIACPGPQAAATAPASRVRASEPAQAASIGSATLSLTPAGTTVQRGKQTVVGVMANAGSHRLGSWTVDIGYDAALVNVVSCEAADGGVCNVDYAAGTVRVTGASAQGLSGSHMLATLTLTGIGGGRSRSTLRLTPVTLTDPLGASVSAAPTAT